MDEKTLRKKTMKITLGDTTTVDLRTLVPKTVEEFNRLSPACQEALWRIGNTQNSPKTIEALLEYLNKSRKRDSLISETLRARARTLLKKSTQTCVSMVTCVIGIGAVTMVMFMWVLDSSAKERIGMIALCSWFAVFLILIANDTDRQMNITSEWKYLEKFMVIWLLLGGCGIPWVMSVTGLLKGSH
jgi:hypothetical protein